MPGLVFLLQSPAFKCKRPLVFLASRQSWRDPDSVDASGGAAFEPGIHSQAETLECSRAFITAAGTQQGVTAQLWARPLVTGCLAHNRTD